MNGPHAWSNAKEAIYNYETRVKEALRTKKVKKVDDSDLGIFDTVYHYLVKFLRDTLHFNNVFVLLVVTLFVLLFWFVAK